MINDNTTQKRVVRIEIISSMGYEPIDKVWPELTKDIDVVCNQRKLPEGLRLIIYFK